MNCVRCSHPLPPKADRCLRCFALNPQNRSEPLAPAPSGDPGPLDVSVVSDPGEVKPVAVSFDSGPPVRSFDEELDAMDAELAALPWRKRGRKPRGNPAQQELRLDPQEAPTEPPPVRVAAATPVSEPPASGTISLKPELREAAFRASLDEDEAAVLRARLRKGVEPAWAAEEKDAPPPTPAPQPFAKSEARPADDAFEVSPLEDSAAAPPRPMPAAPTSLAPTLPPPAVDAAASLRIDAAASHRVDAAPAHGSDAPAQRRIDPLGSLKLDAPAAVAVRSTTQSSRPMFRDRAVAWALDLAVVALCAALHVGLAAAVLGEARLARGARWTADTWASALVLGPGLPVLWAGLAVTLALAYSWLFAALGGRTPGMAARGLRLVDLRGEALSPSRALVRAALALPSAALGLFGFWLALVDPRGQTLHEKLTHSLVIADR